MIILAMALLPLVLAANDPGHDTLYIEQQGDSQLNGTLNITRNMSIAGGRTYQSSGLSIYGNDYMTAPSAEAYISGVTGSHLYLEGQGNLYLKYLSGGDTVYIGKSGITATDLNVSGALYVQGSTATVAGKNICLADGTNCPSSLGGANTTGSGTAGYIAQWKNSSTLNNSVIFQNGTSIGIGTTSPIGALHIIGNINATTNISTPMICLAGDCQTSWPAGGSGGAGWTNTSTQTTTNLKVGIGTTTPTTKLDVNGTINVSAGYDVCIVGGNCLGSSLTSEADTLNSVAARGSTTTLAIGVDTDGNEQTNIGGTLYVNGSESGARVGVGTESPTDVLTVNLVGSDLSKNVTFLLNDSETFKILNNGPAGSALLQASSSLVLGSAGGTYFANLSNGVYHAKVSIRSDQHSYFNAYGSNVGIGTTAPTQKLDVNGSINVTGTSGCVYLPGGGRLCGNTTCSTLYSPNGNTVMQACN